MGVERGQLGVGEAVHVLDVVGLVGLEQQQRVGPVVGEVLLGEEVRVAGRDHALHGQQPGVAVVGVEPVALPGVVAEHDGGPQPADPVRHLPPLSQARLELAVGPAEEHALAGGAERAAAARCSAWRVTTRVATSADGSQLPFEPSVHTRWCTTAPAADHLASVAPQPNSTSSGWAPMARATAGTGRLTRTRPAR